MNWPKFLRRKRREVSPTKDCTVITVPSEPTLTLQISKTCTDGEILTMQGMLHQLVAYFYHGPKERGIWNQLQIEVCQKMKARFGRKA